ncbi:MAG: tRNA (adenosine(37)-N6)-dimethylallyltransferase MiaA, partial [Candidatus Bipolaricaulia bacterium]
VSLSLAQELDGEIISADSRTIYQGLDIGTAKPSSQVRRRIPHYLIDILNFDEDYDVARFRHDVEAVIREIHMRGKQPIVVGGSAMYLAALTGDLFRGPSADKTLRARLEAESNETLYAYLERIDPEAADRIHPNDRQRLIRAIEVYELTGEQISELQRSSKNLLLYNFFKIGLRKPRTQLYRDIERRVDAMIASGWIDEVKELVARGLSPEHQAFQTIGYPEIYAHLNGEIDLEEAVHRIKVSTRHLAKEQMTWFKRDSEIHWIDVSDRSVEEIVKLILDIL